MMTLATGVSGGCRGGSQATVGKELMGEEEMVERNKIWFYSRSWLRKGVNRTRYKGCSGSWQSFLFACFKDESDMILINLFDGVIK